MHHYYIAVDHIFSSYIAYHHHDANITNSSRNIKGPKHHFSPPTTITTTTTTAHSRTANMYGSYGSYTLPSSPITSATTSSPLDISPSTLRTDTCAFPSWPRRSALSSPCPEPRASSYLSDDDLFFPSSSPDDDDATSVSSSGSGSSFASPVGAVEVLSGSQLMEEAMRRQAAKEYVRGLVLEKERKRAAKKGPRRGSGGSKKSKRAMAPIVEGE